MARILVFFFPKKLKEFDDKDLRLCCSRCSHLELAFKYGEQLDIDANKL